MKIEVTVHAGLNTSRWKEKYIVETKNKKIIYQKNYRGEERNGKNN